MATELNQRMDRRDFFISAGKLLIPTLGILGLSLSLGGKAQAADCKGTCSGSCSGGCTSCVGTCATTCEGWNKGMVK